MSAGPGLTVAGKLALAAFVGACLYGAYHLTQRSASVPGLSPAANASAALPPGTRVEIGVAYGTEKKRWLEWAVDEFAKADAGKGVHVTLLPMGSLEAAQAVLRGDQRIQVWSPASALYKDVFVREWQVSHGGNPILREEPLALTPMVFVFWAERHQAFAAKYGSVSLRSVSQALAEKTGWAGIAGKPEWGVFKFGHTDPNESNSGLVTLMLMAYDYHHKTAGLELKDILDPGFQGFMGDFEQAVSGLSNSTGSLMREMVLKGPSTYDALLVYESVAIDYLKSAEGRWGELHLAYPERNFWNDNPYYVLDVPWSLPEQRKAAGTFLDFLLSEPVQKRSIEHGFRPGNPVVPIKTPDSPFVQYQRFGLTLEIGQLCQPPKAEVVNNMLASWQRTRGAR